MGQNTTLTMGGQRHTITIAPTLDTTYVDFAAGLLWNYIPDDKNKITIGASMFHVNKLNRSFSKTDKDLNGINKLR